jgi:hypothetical protein
LTTGIALIFVVLGDVDFVAQIISMFFMVTYGAICTISVLEHFAADPSYRPSFRSRWYVSLVGALACLWCMFEMSALYATLSLGGMFGLYLIVQRATPERRGLSTMFSGAVFQFSRWMQVFAQKSTVDEENPWRPSVVALSRSSFQRHDEFELLRWIAHRHGFGTYIHHLEGYFSKATSEQAQRDLARLVEQADTSDSNVFVDTIVCPSSTSLVAQLVQLPGISGKANNMLLFGCRRGEDDDYRDLTDNYQMIVVAGFDVAILVTSPRGFGYERELHIWLTPEDEENSILMILMAYIVMGHPDWRGGSIRVYALAPEHRLEDEVERLTTLIRDGRLPISRDNIEVVSQGEARDRRELVNERSSAADLVMMGFRGEALRRRGSDLFSGLEELGNVLFVSTTRGVDLERPEEPEVEPEEQGEEDVVAPELPQEDGAPATVESPKETDR